MNTELNPNKKFALRRARVFTGVLTYAVAILALLCLIGIIVTVLMLNFGERTESEESLLYVLSGAFAGGAAFMALLTFLFSKSTSKIAAKELDYRERLDGEESFFVGEGTLLTFGESGFVLHGEKEGEYPEIFVPYQETRFISVCTRLRPKEKGSWCVAIEIPAKYLSKKNEGNKGEKLLVQADAKERLYAALENHGIPLLGEERTVAQGNTKFTLVKKFYLPNRKKRQTAIISLAVGAVLLAGSVVLGILVNASAGALLGAAALIVFVRALISFFKARAVFGVYEEGIYWSESSGTEKLFLKWEDIEGIYPEEQGGLPVLVFKCAYGRYALPAVEGAYDCIMELQKEAEEALNAEPAAEETYDGAAEFQGEDVPVAEPAVEGAYDGSAMELQNDSTMELQQEDAPQDNE